jgi:hypothetical protein
MGMTNDEIAAMIAGGVVSKIAESAKGKQPAKKDKVGAVTPVTAEENAVDLNMLISQADIDSVLTLFVSDDGNNSNKQMLIDEIHTAILDSGRLTLAQWVNLRKKLSEIESLIPHIDLIIRLKGKKERAAAME